MPREERIDLALSQLIDHTVPAYDDEDPDIVEQRLDDAYMHAHELIDTYEMNHSFFLFCYSNL